MKGLRGLAQLLVVLVFMQVALPGNINAQSVENSLLVSSDAGDQESAVTLEHVLDKIEKRYRVTFLYEEHVVAGKYLNSKRMPLDQATGKKLAQVLIALNLDYHQLDEETYVLVDKKTSLLSSSLFQQQIVTGTVTDVQSGETLPGVNVMVKGTTIGTSTGSDGSYELDAPSLQDTLIFSFIGYQTREVLISGRTEIDVELQPQAIQGEEMVVVGYGTQRKEEVTGSVSSIEGEDIVEVPATNISNTLGGRIPGLIAVKRDGTPGSGSSISVRGASTFGNNDALIVVDGIVREDFDYIDPNSIEDISVLKDASATAVYGSRAANGVILVTTKRGVSGKPTFNYNTFIGIQQPTDYPRLLNGYEFATTRNVALENEGEPPLYSEETLEEIRTGQIPETDWYRITLKDRAYQMRHNLNVRGGSDAIKYFMSLAYEDQEGMYEQINYSDYSLRSNMDANINSNLTVSADINLSRGNDNGSSYSAQRVFNDIIGAYPLDRAYNPDGSIAYTNEAHPLAETTTGYNESITDRIVAILTLNQEIPFVKGLTAEGKVSLYKESTDGTLYQVPVLMDRQVENIITADEEDFGETIEIYPTGGFNGKTALTESSFDYNSITLNARLNYDRTFGNHEIDGLILFEQFSAKSNNHSAFRTNFPAIGLDELLFGGELEKDANGGSYEDARRSFVGRVNYGYKNRYLFQASLRIDGSVAFPSTKKYGYFPATSAGWRLSEEPFFKNSPKLAFIDNLKLRASFGIIGNDQNVYNDRIPTFQYRQVYGISPAIFISGTDPQSAIYPGVLPNPNVTWETAYNYDLGLDGSLWNSKLEFELGIFYKRTSDILLSRIRSIPRTFGAALPAENYAKVDNQGIEVSFTHNNNIGGLNYFVGLNGSYTRNKVIKLDEPANLPDRLKQTGRPLDFIVGYKAVGFFQSEEEIENHPPQFAGGQVPGDVKYADVNGDGRIDASDETIISMDNNTPKIMGGLLMGGSYKGFDLNILFQGAAKMKRLLYEEARYFFQNGSRNTYAPLLDYWTPENRNAKYPRPTEGYDVNNSRPSNLYLRDTKYIRLKSINLGYNLPNSVVENLGIEKLRVYFSGSNLFHIDAEENMFDPEMPSGGGDYYPQQRSFNLGLNLTF